MPQNSAVVLLLASAVTFPAVIVDGAALDRRCRLFHHRLACHYAGALFGIHKFVCLI